MKKIINKTLTKVTQLVRAKEKAKPRIRRRKGCTDFNKCSVFLTLTFYRTRTNLAWMKKEEGKKKKVVKILM